MIIQSDKTEKDILALQFKQDLKRVSGIILEDSELNNIEFGNLSVIDGQAPDSGNDEDFNVNTQIEVSLNHEGQDKHVNYKYRRLSLEKYVQWLINSQTITSSYPLDEKNTYNFKCFKHEKTDPGVYRIKDDYTTLLKDALKETIKLPEAKFTPIEDSHRSVGIDEYSFENNGSILLSGKITANVLTRSPEVGMITDSGNQPIYYDFTDMKDHSSVEIKQLEFPANATKIPERAFENAMSTANFALEIPKRITTIGERAFANSVSRLDYVSFHPEIEYLGERAFGSAYTNHLSLPEGFNPKHIGDNALGTIMSLTVDLPELMVKLILNHVIDPTGTSFNYYRPLEGQGVATLYFDIAHEHNYIPYTEEVTHLLYDPDTDRDRFYRMVESIKINPGNVIPRGFYSFGGGGFGNDYDLERLDLTETFGVEEGALNRASIRELILPHYGAINIHPNAMEGMNVESVTVPYEQDAENYKQMFQFARVSFWNHR